VTQRHGWTGSSERSRDLDRPHGSTDGSTREISDLYECWGPPLPCEDVARSDRRHGIARPPNGVFGPGVDPHDALLFVVKRAFEARVGCDASATPSCRSGYEPGGRTARRVRQHGGLQQARISQPSRSARRVACDPREETRPRRQETLSGLSLRDLRSVAPDVEAAIRPQATLGLGRSLGPSGGDVPKLILSRCPRTDLASSSSSPSREPPRSVPPILAACAVGGAGQGREAAERTLEGRGTRRTLQGEGVSLQ
jgi:hypothetical protein